MNRNWLTRRLATVALLGLVAASGVAAGANALNTGPPMEVFSTPATAEDRLPARVLRSPSAAVLTSLEQARRVAAVAGAAYFVVPATEERTCIVDVDEKSLGFACHTQQAINEGRAWSSTLRGGKRVVAVPVPDGYTAARVIGTSTPGKAVSQRVRDNVVVTTLKDHGRFELSGEGLRRLTVKVRRLPSGLGL